MFCTNCGASNEPGTQYCTKCGASLAGAAPSATGTPGAAPTQAPYQPPPAQQYPGTPQYQGYAPPSYDPNAKSKLAAGLLGIFLGWLGVHRFYLGYNNIAMAQLAVGVVGLILSPFTCGLILIGASVWGLVDGIMILTGSIRVDGQGRPLRD